MRAKYSNGKVLYFRKGSACGFTILGLTLANERFRALQEHYWFFKERLLW